MSIVQIGGFSTALPIGRVYINNKEQNMIPVGLKAGSVALRMLKTLYKAKKKVGKGTSFVADKAAKGGFTKTSKAITGASQKVHSGLRKTKALAKEYPKSAAALGGAIGYDIFDDD